MSPALIILIILVVIIIIVIFWIIGAKNRMMREEQNIFTEYSNAKLVVERRFKNLEGTVNLMKSHNAAIAQAYQNVIAMRNQNVSPQPGGTNGQKMEPHKYAQMDEMMQGMVKNINLTVERYPELGQMFDANKFQTTMSQHDRDVEMAKKLYNNEVEQFNTLIQTIPYSWVAGSKSIHEYWEVKDFDTKDEFIPQF